MNKLFGRSWLLKLSIPLVGACLGVLPFIVNADDETSAYPKRTVTIVVPVAPGGVTLMIVTHEMSFAHKVSDRVAFMKDGLIHETGSAADIFERPQSSELKTFLSHFRV